MRWLVVACVGCWTSTPPVPAPAPAPTTPALEVTPSDLGAHPPGLNPAVTIAIVNHTQRTYVIPQPGPNAWLGAAAPLRWTYEQRRADGTWEPLSPSWYTGHPLRTEEPGGLISLAPGKRVALAGGVPPLGFPEDLLGTLRARFTYDVDAELARFPNADASRVGTLVSNWVTLEQVPGPLELRLEQIAPVVVGQDLDPSRIFRVTLRNRSSRQLTIYGPGGTTASLGFDLHQPNGGVWPKGDRPAIELAPGPAKTALLRAGASVEIYGPSPAFGAIAGTWRYPVAETFRIRAMFSQPGQPHIHYSNWVTITAR